MQDMQEGAYPKKKMKSVAGQFAEWILIGEFIGTTSLGNSFFVQSSGLK
jgi:hypothetical protein